jgi:hypothetical protein
LFFIIFLVDRVGRKKPLLFGSFMLAACLAVETAINAQVGALLVAMYCKSQS